MMGVLNTDGQTIVHAEVDPNTHVLDINDGATGSDNGGNNVRDANSYPVLMAVSNADGTTPIALYFDSSGKLLVQST